MVLPLWHRVFQSIARKTWIVSWTRFARVSTNMNDSSLILIGLDDITYAKRDR